MLGSQVAPQTAKIRDSNAAPRIGRLAFGSIRFEADVRFIVLQAVIRNLGFIACALPSSMDRVYSKGSRLLGSNHTYGRSLVYDWHLERLAQQIVISNSFLANQHKQVTPDGILHRVHSKLGRVQDQINRVAHLEGNVIPDNVRASLLDRLMRSDVHDCAHLILRCGLTKGGKGPQTDADHAN